MVESTVASSWEGRGYRFNRYRRKVYGLNLREGTRRVRFVTCYDFNDPQLHFTIVALYSGYE